jgi:hypothetical protein
VVLLYSCQAISPMSPYRFTVLLVICFCGLGWGSILTGILLISLILPPGIYAYRYGIPVPSTRGTNEARATTQTFITYWLLIAALEFSRSHARTTTIIGILYNLKEGQACVCSLTGRVKEHYFKWRTPMILLKRIVSLARTEWRHFTGNVYLSVKLS